LCCLRGFVLILSPRVEVRVHGFYVEVFTLLIVLPLSLLLCLLVLRALTCVVIII